MVVMRLLLRETGLVNFRNKSPSSVIAAAPLF
jgi:hypothetical protein